MSVHLEFGRAAADKPVSVYGWLAKGESRHGIVMKQSLGLQSVKMPPPPPQTYTQVDLTADPDLDGQDSDVIGVAEACKTTLQAGRSELTRYEAQDVGPK